MQSSSEIYSFRKEDFIPIKGVFEYVSRTFPTKDSPKNVVEKSVIPGMKAALLLHYNFALVRIGRVAIEGLENIIR